MILPIAVLEDLDKLKNSEKMKGSPLCFQLTMHADECLRSALAFDATQRM